MTLSFNGSGSTDFNNYNLRLNYSANYSRTGWFFDEDTFTPAGEGPYAPGNSAQNNDYMSNYWYGYDYGDAFPTSWRLNMVAMLGNERSDIANFTLRLYEVNMTSFFGFPGGNQIGSSAQTLGWRAFVETEGFDEVSFGQYPIDLSTFTGTGPPANFPTTQRAYVLEASMQYIRGFSWTGLNIIACTGKLGFTADTTSPGITPGSYPSADVTNAPLTPEYSYSTYINSSWNSRWLRNIESARGDLRRAPTRSIPNGSEAYITMETAISKNFWHLNNIRFGSDTLGENDMTFIGSSGGYSEWATPTNSTGSAIDASVIPITLHRRFF